MAPAPFAPDLVNAAVLLLVNKTTEAVRIAGGDLDKANRIIWDWCASDEALRTAFLRVLFAQNSVRQIALSALAPDLFTAHPAPFKGHSTGSRAPWKDGTWDAAPK